MTSRHLLLLMIALALPAAAQAPKPPAVPIQGVKLPPPPVEAAVDTGDLGDKTIIEDIIYPKMNGVDLAGLYRRYTGRRVIVTTAASTAEFAFVQEASAADPLTFSEAAELLRKAAVLEGFVFTEHPDDPKLDILTLATGGPRPTNVKVDVYTKATPLPEEDIVISYLMQLNYLKPDQAVAIFTQVIGQLGAYGSISAVPNASALVITEKASLIKSLVALQEVIDVSGSVQAEEFIQVQHADVTELAAVLTELMTSQQSSQGTAAIQRVATPAGGGAAPTPAAASGSAPAGGGETTPVQVIPDARTNRILVVGHPKDLKYVGGLIEKFDVKASALTTMNQKLHFLSVADFLPVAGDALERAFTGTGGGTAEAGAGSGTQQRARPSSNNNRNSSNRNNNNTSGFSNNNRGGYGNQDFGGGSGTASASLSDPDVSTAPESMLIGRTLLVADNITNSIVVQGPPSALEIVRNLLAQLDVKPQQVMISTVIGQMTLNKSKELGFNYLVDGKDVRGGGGGSGFSVVDPLATTFPQFNPGSLASSGLRVYGQIGDLSSYLRALSSKTDFTVLSRPSIFTSNNKRGVISSGEKIAIPTEAATMTGGYSSGTRIQYQDVVLKLEVIPLVNSNNEITMDIALLNDEQNGTQEIAGAGAGGTEALVVPRIATREILTTVTVPNNQTIVLGGLITGRNSKERSGIPILSDIPVVGALFGSNSKLNDRSELMVFIQPSVIGNDTMLDEVQQDMHLRYDVSDEMNGFAKDESKLFGGTPAPVESPEESKPRLSPAHRRR